MNDPAKLLLGESPPAPTPARLLTRQPGALGSWGHLLPLSERQLASATLRCLRNAMPHSVIVRVLQYAIVDDEPLETTLALVDRAIRNEVPVQEKGPPTGTRPCQSRWWNQYRRAVVDSLHGLAERCELELVVAHHAAKLVDLIWLLPHSQNDEKAWTAKTLRSRAAYLCVGALRVAADAHNVDVCLRTLEQAVPDLFAQQCRQSDARECELYVRQHIGWRVLTPTPLHFLRIYVSKRPLYPESTDVLADHHRNQPVNDEVRVERLFLYVQKWCCFFCSMCLQHREFSGDKVPSAKLAAAVLLVARRNLKLTPAWRPELEAMTSFTLAEVAPVADRIFEVYEDEFREFQREHEARAQAGAAQAGDEEDDGVDMAAVAAAADAAVAAPDEDAAVAAIRSAFGEADEQRAAAQAAIDLLAGRGNLGAGMEHTITSIALIDRLAAEFGVEDVPDLRAEEERLMAEARRFGEMVRNNPAMLARFRAARAVAATTDDEAVAVIRSANDGHQAAARAAIEQLVARGVNGMPLQEDNARIDRFVAEFGVEPPQI